MKVVLFCGGLGTRLREHSDTIPKPLVFIGARPILWHLMRYYAHYGHKDFVLALGYRGDMVREYFLNYNEAMSNDFTLSDGGRSVELHGRDVHDWRITFVDTGLHSNIGQRLLRVRKYVEGEPVFLANYSDGLSDLPLDHMLQAFDGSAWTASFAAVRPSSSLHAVRADASGLVTDIGPLSGGGALVNGGYFILRREVFDDIREGEELVEKPFQRLIQRKKLYAYRYDGFWQAMDTFKDKIAFDRMESSGNCPWKVWKQ
jgi:glucose-1-phosphate cytidylyltransferase